MKRQFNFCSKVSRHRLGRPRKPKGERRVKPLRLFLAEDEEALLLRNADLAGMNKHDFVRALIVDQEPQIRVIGTADPKELLALNCIGNLLNQIARQLNSGNPVRTSVIETLALLKRHLTRTAIPD